MSEFNPIYGELLTSREVSDLTGFTLNQLRNQRQRPDTSPFPFVRQGGTSWYRKDDIDLWVADNGGIQFDYVVPGEVRSAPLRNSTVDAVHRKNLDVLAKINTANAWSKWFGWLLEESGWGYDRGEPMWIAKMDHFSELTLGKSFKDVCPSARSYSQVRTIDPIAYWPVMTYAMRACVAEVYGWDVSDEEILAAPVGDNPPMNGGGI